MTPNKTQPFNDLPPLPPDGIDLETPGILKKLAPRCMKKKQGTGTA
jgi:hypothetical protein